VLTNLALARQKHSRWLPSPNLQSTVGSGETKGGTRTLPTVVDYRQLSIRQSCPKTFLSTTPIQKVYRLTLLNLPINIRSFGSILATASVKQCIEQSSISSKGKSSTRQARTHHRTQLIQNLLPRPLQQQQSSQKKSSVKPRITGSQHLLWEWCKEELVE